MRNRLKIAITTLEIICVLALMTFMILDIITGKFILLCIGALLVMMVLVAIDVVMEIEDKQ